MRQYDEDDVRDVRTRGNGDDGPDAPRRGNGDDDRNRRATHREAWPGWAARVDAQLGLLPGERP